MAMCLVHDHRDALIDSSQRALLPQDLGFSRSRFSPTPPGVHLAPVGGGVSFGFLSGSRAAETDLRELLSGSQAAASSPQGESRMGLPSHRVPRCWDHR